MAHRIIEAEAIGMRGPRTRNIPPCGMDGHLGVTSRLPDQAFLLMFAPLMFQLQVAHLSDLNSRYNGKNLAFKVGGAVLEFDMPR